MNENWHFLREFESKDLVKRFIKKKYGYEINTSKAIEITSAFAQGREYFSSSLKADITVSPLLQYYAILALSRGLVLILRKEARENNLYPSHGLKISNWDEVSKKGSFENIMLKSSKGTFNELLSATQNKIYLRAGSSAINFHITHEIPITENEYNFREIVVCFPNLRKSTESWLDSTTIFKPLISFEHKNGRYKIALIKNHENKTSHLENALPSHLYRNLKVEEKASYDLIEFDSDYHPNLCQWWASSSPRIGDACIAPPFNNKVFINDISKMYILSFVFGTISRYYPSTWNNIHKGIAHDSIFPFSLNSIEFLHERFSQIIVDFIESPYEFEK